MINDNELMISNKSYINKDFATIYPELLDYVKILTNKWNPQTSNESDPGIVLLKLLAFMGDKENYNIDKNALENFVLSCTQESSMRKNLFPLGYSMKYYNSATTKIQFTYVGEELDASKGNNRSFTLPALDTVITTDDGSVQFVLTQPVTISYKNIPSVAWAIQGRKDTLMAGDSDVIQLENIDSNNRLYFPINMVAQNGVFIHRVDYPNEEPWERVNNLNVLTPNKTAFLFGYDSARGLPYIEFPEDISELIGSGLHIDYIITNGLDGNVSAKALTQLASPDSAIITGTDEEISFKEEDDTSLLIIKNLSASIDGANPETINEAYNNFKKTIGTFDTLVTCRDYANYIYNLYDDVRETLVVSNAQVSDRRDDITYTTSVVSFDTYGQKLVNVQNSVNENIKPYDLFLYPLTPISSYTIEGFNNSFTPLVSTTWIKDALENAKCASHNYHDFKNSPLDIYLIKNMVKLDAKIATTYKVNAYERKDIIANVIGALIKRFNARNVDYGYEIPYSEILDTIEGADTRISYVNLLEPELTTRIVNSNFSGETQEVNLISSAGLDYLLQILAHNVLSGRVALFDYDNMFNYDFCQKPITRSASLTPMVFEKLKEIKTETKIPLSTGSAYTLLENEVVQIVAPSLVTDMSYAAYTKYFLEPSTLVIEDGENYQLKNNEYLWIYYTDSSTGNVVVKRYDKGTIIQPKGFKLGPLTNDSSNGGVQKTFEYEGATKSFWMPALKAQESIEIRKVNKTKFTKPTYFYWLRNNSNNALFTSSEAIHIDPTDPTSSIIGYEAILGDGEYVFYTDEGFNSLVSLGSGTTIRTNISNISNLVAPKIEWEDIEDEGLLAVKEKWQFVNLTDDTNPGHGTYIEAQENTIVTLTQGDKITWTEASGATTHTLTLGNDLIAFEGTISYQFKDGDEPEHLEAYRLDDASSRWRIKSRLDINSGKNLTQRINATYQEITFKLSTGVTKTLNTINESFNLNESYQFMGANAIDVTSKDIVTGALKYPFSVYCWYPQLDSNNKIMDIGRDANGYAHFDILKNSTQQGEYFDYDLPSVSSRYKLLMLYVELPNSSTTLTITPSNSGGASTLTGVRHYNTLASGSTTDWESFDSSITIDKSGIYTLEFEPNVNHLQITSNNTTSKTLLVVDYFKVIKEISYGTTMKYGLNPDLGITSEVARRVTPGGQMAYTIGVVERKLLDKIRTLDDSTQPKFYYTNRISNSKAIETDNMLDPLTLFEVNNVANKFTLSQIDMETISEDIDIMRSSRL